MEVNYNENIFPFDVDNTLVGPRMRVKTETSIELVNPYTNETVYVEPFHRHIDLLKESRGRGRFIVVHSAAGVKWAEAVVDALKIRHWVHRCETKPVGYVDDKPVETWLTNRIYLDEGERT